jgi:AraC family transcriptional regulator of adaptative response/methylated-DNA-[protein]-cysteine methyltransferase
METIELPPRVEMLRAFATSDSSFDGVFVTGVTTTGIFCRPSCSARKPLARNVLFFATPREALFEGFRPCLRCRPLEPASAAPEWLEPLLREIEADPGRRWRDADLRSEGLEPERIRRWFKKHHGMTFQAYSRARRLGRALDSVRNGERVTRSALENGFDSLSGFNDAIRRSHGVPPSEAGGRRILMATRLQTPLGAMIACADDDALCLLEFADRRMLETQFERIRKRLGAILILGDNRVTASVAGELDAYFNGRLREFKTRLDVSGTSFQESVWNALREIPYGTTASYEDVARVIGRPEAVRAVARANGDNRIAIIVPCHRVIGKDGSLTGYGGGLWRKRRLLDIESGQLSLGGALDGV